METQTFQFSHPLLGDAEAAARGLGHGFVAPEHLLLAVAGRREGASARFVESRGLTAEALRREVEAVLGPAGSPAPAGPLRLTQRAVVARDAVVGAVLERARVDLADARAEFARATAGEFDA